MARKVSEGTKPKTSKKKGVFTFVGTSTIINGVPTHTGLPPSAYGSAGPEFVSNAIRAW